MRWRKKKERDFRKKGLAFAPMGNVASLLPECVTPVAMNARLRDVLAPYAGYISKSKDRSKEKTERSFDILLV